MSSSDTPQPIKKRKPIDVRWCGDLRTVLEAGPFDEAPLTTDEAPSAPPTTKHAA